MLQGRGLPATDLLLLQLSLGMLLLHWIGNGGSDFGGAPLAAVLLFDCLRDSPMPYLKAFTSGFKANFAKLATLSTLTRQTATETQDLRVRCQSTESKLQPMKQQHFGMPQFNQHDDLI